jgi:hypothetical protein
MKRVADSAVVEVDDRHARTPPRWVLRGLVGPHLDVSTRERRDPQ